MKKSFKILTFLILASMLIFAAVGCGQDDPAPVDPDEPAELKTVSIAAASVGGAMYAVSGALATVWRDIGVRPSIEVTGGSIHNSELLQRKEVLTALISQGAIYEAWHGIGLFEGKGEHQDVRAVMPLHVSYMHAWSLDSSIQSYRDLEGKNVSGGPAGGTSDIWFRVLQDAIGAPPANFVTAGFSDTVGLLRDGLIDAANTSGGVPTAAALESTSTLGAHIFGVKYDEDIEKIQGVMPFLGKLDLPAGSYPGQDEPVTTVADWNAYFVHKDLPDDAVYEFTKKAFEAHALLVSTFGGLETAIPENVQFIVLPLHPGAYRFYQEMGIEVPEAAMPID